MGESLNKYKTLHKIAKAHHGVITSQELKNNNISAKQIRTLRNNGILTTVYKGLYVLSISNDTWLRRATLEQKRFKHGLLSHESVLHLYKLIDFQYDKNRYLRDAKYTRNLIHCINPCKYLRDNEHYHHKSTRYLDKDRINTHNGIQHVSLARAIIDCSSQLSDTEISYCTEKAIRMGLTSVVDIETALSKLSSAPGRNILRINKLLELIDIRKDKCELESYFEQLVEDAIKPLSKFELVRQHNIEIAGTKMRIDHAILELKIAIESDGYDRHGIRSAYDKDKLRSALLQSQGWHLLNLTTKMPYALIKKLFLDIQNQALLAQGYQ